MPINALPLLLAGTGQWVDTPYSRATIESVRACLKICNPSWGSDIRYNVNCQKCVLAYEISRRGVPCEALPTDVDGGDEFYERWFEYMRAKSEVEEFASGGLGTVFSAITRRMEELGKHARAILYVKWKDKEEAHVFILENLGERLVCGNPQNGHVIDLAKKLEDVELDKIHFIRMDRMHFDPEEVFLFARYL